MVQVGLNGNIGNAFVTSFVEAHPSLQRSAAAVIQLEDGGKVTDIATELAQDWLSPRNVTAPPVVTPIVTSRGAKSHASVALLTQTADGPHVEIFDPVGFHGSLSVPFYRKLRNALPSKNVTWPTIKMQGDLGLLQNCSNYGQCAFLSATVLEKAVKEGTTLTSAAKSIVQQVGRDGTRGKKLDIYMLGSMARATGLTSRQVLGFPPPAMKGKRARADTQPLAPPPKAAKLMQLTTSAEVDALVDSLVNTAIVSANRRGEKTRVPRSFTIGVAPKPNKARGKRK